MIIVKLVTWQDAAVQFSDKIQDFPADLKKTQSSVIMCFYPQLCMEFLTILETTTLMASRTDTITSLPKFGPLAQNSF